MRPVGSAAVRPPPDAVPMSWEASVRGGAFQEDGVLLFGVCLGTVPLHGPFRDRDACASPRRLLSEEPSELLNWPTFGVLSLAFQGSSAGRARDGTNLPAPHGFGVTSWGDK